MVVVFSSFLLNDERVVNLFGFGLAVAIAVDATVVRLVLVPAAMAVAGRAAWYLPRWLDRLLPRIAHEPGDAVAPPVGSSPPAALALDTTEPG
jgi:RND superfamily putative drug exporter